MKNLFFVSILLVFSAMGCQSNSSNTVERRVEQLDSFTINPDSFGIVKKYEIPKVEEANPQPDILINQDSFALELIKQHGKKLDVEIDTSLYYLRIFENPSTKSLFAIIVMFEPDATFIFTKRKDKWQIVNKLTTPDFMRVSPIWSEFGDYNFDGSEDIALHRTTSNGWASLYYNVFLFRPKTVDYEFKKDFTNLGCPVILKEVKRIKARHASCGGGCFEIEEYRWNADTLQIAKLLEKRMLSDTLTTSYFSETGILTKIEKRGISKGEKDEILNYCSTDKKH